MKNEQSEVRQTIRRLLELALSTAQQDDDAFLRYLISMAVARVKETGTEKSHSAAG